MADPTPRDREIAERLAGPHADHCDGIRACMVGCGRRARVQAIADALRAEYERGKAASSTGQTSL